MMKIQEFDSSQEGYRPTREQIAEFLHTITLGEVASVNETGQPQVATVAFSETEDCTIIIGTDENSRKARNIEHDGRVAFVATDPDQRYTLQLEGVAHKLTPDEFKAYEERHFEKLPASAPFRDIEGQCYIRISPTWLRFSDCNPHPWILTEYTDTTEG